MKKVKKQLSLLIITGIILLSFGSIYTFADTISLVNDAFTVASDLGSWAIANNEGGSWNGGAASNATVNVNTTDGVLEYTVAPTTTAQTQMTRSVTDTADNSKKLVISYDFKMEMTASDSNATSRVAQVNFKNSSNTSLEAYYLHVAAGYLYLNAPNAGGSGNDNYGLFSAKDGNWHTITTVSDFSTGKFELFVSGVSKGLFTMRNSGLVIFSDMQFYVNQKITNTGNIKLSLDNVMVKRISALSVSTNIGTTNVDPTAPIALTFSTPVTQSAVAAALTINKDGTAISNSLGVALSPDGMTATISVDGGLGYNKAYNLNLSSSFKDIYGQTINNGYTYSFSTIETDPNYGILVNDTFTAASDLNKWAIANNEGGTWNGGAASNATVNVNTTDGILEYTVAPTTTAQTQITRSVTDTADNSKKLVISYDFKMEMAASDSNGTSRVAQVNFKNSSNTSLEAYFLHVAAGYLYLNAPNAGGSGNDNYGLFSAKDGNWHTITTVSDFSTGKFELFVGGVSKGLFTMRNSGLVIFSNMQFYVNQKTTNTGNIKLSLDNVMVKRISALSFTANIGTANVDPTAPIVLTFSTPINSSVLTYIRLAKNGSESVAIDTVLSQDGKTVTITPKYVLGYSITSYTITFDSGFKDIYSQTTGDSYTFTTLKSSSVYLDNFNVTITDNSVNCYVDIYNSSDEAKPVWVIVAAYGAQNMLLAAKVQTIDSLAGGASLLDQQFDLTVDNGSEVTFVKAYAWDTPQSIKPYYMPEVYPVQQ